MDIKVTKCAISELMPIEGKGNYNIPEYQRNYSWSEDNIETLIQDIINEDNGYYLGNIIITSKSDSEDTYDIVDGQQRFTTITLIFLAIYDILNDATEITTLSKEQKTRYERKKFDIERRLTFEEKFNKVSFNFSEQIKLNLLEPDRSIYFDLIDRVINFKTDKKQHKNKILGKRYQSIKKNLLNKFFESDIILEDNNIDTKVNNLIDFYTKLIDANILKIEVTNLNDAFTIFTSFNAKGVPLTLIDLFKSYYIREAGDSPGVIDKWYQLLNIFNNKNEEPISDVVTQFLLNNYDTFENTSKSSITRGSALNAYDTIFSEKKGDYIEDLIYRAKLFSLLNPKINTINNNLNTSTVVKLEKLSTLESTQVIPVVLFLLDKLIKNKTSIDIFEDFIDFLISYYVRRNFILRPKSSNIRAKSLQCIRDYQNVDIIDQTIINKFKEYFKSIAAPDEFFRQSLSDSVYTTSKRTTRFVLVELERKNSKFFTKQNPENLESVNSSGAYIWTLEHILPQSAEGNKLWRTELIESGVNEDDLSSKLEEYTHKIGNLTLTGYNSEMSSKSFKDKRDYREKESLSEVGLKTKLWLNESIPNNNESIDQKESWTLEDIDRRTDFLVNEILSMYTLD